MNAPVRLSSRVKRSGKAPISFLMEQAVANPQVISLAAGLVDTESLPVDSVRRSAERLLSDPAWAKSALQYGTTPGDVNLRERIAAHISDLDARAGGAVDPISPANVIIGSGSQQLLYLASEALLDPGDLVLMGVPTYFVYMDALENLGVDIVGIPTDEQGVVPEAIENALSALERSGQLSRVKLIYDVPYFNNPTGWTLSASRRAQVVELAKKWSEKCGRIFVVEDAAYRELRYQGDALPSLYSHDADRDTVLYVGTFSKSFSPGLKTGYMIVPPALVEPMVSQKGHHDFGSSNFLQQLLADCLANGALAEQNRLLTQVYRDKLQVMLDELERGLTAVSDQVVWTKPEGGLYVWLELPEGISTNRDGEFFQQCLKEGVLYVPGEFCYPKRHPRKPSNCVRLSFGVQPPAMLARGVDRLCRAIVEKVRAGDRA